MTRINTNVSSLVAQNRLQTSNNDLQTALTRLSTGLRINSGSDDPAGLIASEALRSEITSLGKAISNTQRASQIISTADSALGQVSSLLNDVRGLVVEAANSGALSPDEIAANQLQVDSSLEAINRISQTTTFQGRKLLDGSLGFQTVAGANFGNVKELKIDQANLGSTGSVSVDVTINAAAKRARVSLDIPVGIPAVAATGSVALSDAAGVNSAAGSLEFTQSNAAVASSATFAIGGADFTLDADTAGIAGDAISITVVAGGTAGTGAVTTASGTDYTITLASDFAGTAGDLETSFNAAATGVATLTAANSANGVAAASPLATTNLTGGVDASTSTATVDVTADIAGTAGNVNIVFTKTTGATTSASINGSGDIEVVVNDTGTTTLEEIRAAIDGISGFSAAITNTDTIPVGDYDNTTADPTLTDLTGGTDGPASTATLALTATSTGAAANTATISFAKVNGTTTPFASVDSSGNITVTVNDTGSATIASIVSAINSEGTYSAVPDTTGGLTSVNTETFTDTPTAFSGGIDSSGGLAEAVVFELQGKTGSEVFNVSKGTTIGELVSQINLVSDATGITANANGQSLQLVSSDYGADAVVDLRVIQEATTGTFTSEIEAGVRAAGADIKAKVNGIDASGRGNTLSINTATLDLSLTVEDGSSAAINFTINGGGAKFQLGADVVGNQQARIGIDSVNTARLGGASGKLFQLGSGGSASLANDATTAARIVTEAIDQVTSLRGRLGAFQATTLESNIVSLGETRANLLEAESSIRDADFAQESANLTRAQILVQSGTNVLSLANQNPQNVLSLLR